MLCCAVICSAVPGLLAGIRWSSHAAGVEVAKKDEGGVLDREEEEEAEEKEDREWLVRLNDSHGCLDKWSITYVM